MTHSSTTDTMSTLDGSKPINGNSRCFVRLNADEKAQHLIFVVCFFMLAVTGLMVWLPEKAFDFLGGAKEAVFSVRSFLHRLFGIIMILTSLYHLYYLAFKPAGRRWFMGMMLTPGDIKEMFHNLLYLIEAKDAPPEFDRFSYKQKAEYAALIAGTTLMSISGLMLWSEFYWDKFFVDIAALVHGMEAVLACLSIMVWHLYEIHLRPHKFPIDTMWLTGVIDEEEMKEEYPLHFKKIMSDPELQKIYIQEGLKRHG
jgi:cytochrome b subunit of formate dehydrogenase